MPSLGNIKKEKAMPKIVKTEHTGAKHGKSYWGSKKEAKTLSRKARRCNDKTACKEER